MASMEELSGQIAGKLVPILADAVESISEFMQKNQNALESLGMVVATVASAIANLIKVISALPPQLVTIIAMVLVAVKAFTSVQKALTPTEGALKAMGKSMDVWKSSADGFIAKVLAVAAALSVLLFLILAIKEGTDKAAKSMDSIGKNMSNIPNPNANIPRSRGFAKGTSYAPPGLAWVGERGPELVRFRGGERVWNASQSAKMASASAYTDNSQIVLNVNGIEEMQQVVNWFQGRRMKARAGGTL